LGWISQIYPREEPLEFVNVRTFTGRMPFLYPADSVKALKEDLGAGVDCQLFQLDVESGC